MRVAFHTGLETTNPPDEVSAPWLSGRGPRRMLVRDFELSVDGRRYVVPAGYVFDGSSIPWWLWWLYPPGYDPAWRASCFHDWCYSHLYRQVSKRFADAAFRSIMLKDGASPWVAKAFHAAVSRFGRGGW